MTPGRKTGRRTCGGLTWPLLVVVLAIVAAFALAWWSLQTPPYVAKVNGQGITRTELATALRAEVWKRGLTWATLTPQDQAHLRQTALDALITDRLVAALPVQTSAARGEEAFQQFIKQFDTEEYWRARMEAQGLTEAKLKEQLTAEADRIAALDGLVAAKGPQVTEADAMAWFQNKQPPMMVPERVRASHLFLSGHDREKPDREPEIREFYRQLTAGEATLEDLATKLSEDDRSKKAEGNLGWFSRERVPQDFADQVFSLTPGALSAPFQTKLGWHILRVEKKLPARPAEFKEVVPEIMALLQSELRAARVQEVITDLRAQAKIEQFDAVWALVQPAP